MKMEPLMEGEEADAREVLLLATEKGDSSLGELGRRLGGAGAGARTGARLESSSLSSVSKTHSSS
jgi:hypothetical protein